MPSVVCEKPRSEKPRSSSAGPVQSPPRKRFKFSLKLKAKKKGLGKISRKENSTHDNEKEDCEQKGEDCEQMAEENTSDTLLADVPEVDTAIPPLPFAGLANLGNTCYLNAVLQVLRYCPKFVKSLENLDGISCQDSTTITSSMNDETSVSVDDVTVLRPSIINSIQKLAHEMANAEVNYHTLGIEAKEVKNRSGCTTLAVHPQEFVKDFSGVRPMFGGYEQHDAQEFLRSLLSLVEEDCIGLDKGINAQKDNNMKENTIQSNTSDSKIRGGSKYPHKLPGDVIIETVAEPTSMTLTSECRMNNGNCSEDQNNTGAPGVNKTFTTKCFDKDFNCPKCATSNQMNVVKRLFEGTLLLQTCCLNCEGVRQRYENFQDISVPVQNTKQECTIIEEEVNMVSDSEDESEKDVNLSWAISKFASVERLQGENKYYCDSCATLTEAEISSYFEKLPQVLTIHLKRFQTCYGQSHFLSSWVTKVTKSLHTPQQLCLAKWCSKTCNERSAVYTLFGVIMHSGMGSCSGHYLSYVNVHLLNEQSAVVEDIRGSSCSCQGRNPDKPDDGEKTDGVKESVQPGLEDSSVMKSRDTGIAKYFQVLKKSKASVGTHKSTSNMENLSCKEDACHSNNTITCTTSMAMYSVDEISQAQDSKLDQQTDDASMPDTSTECQCAKTEAKDFKMANKDSLLSSSETKWLKFDDAEVQEMSKKEMDEVLSPSSSCYSTPYLLFYFRS